nr:MAG TPA: hypothetical protein [Caudoviricetes sp.]
MIKSIRNVHSLFSFPHIRDGIVSLIQLFLLHLNIVCLHISILRFYYTHTDIIENKEI